MIDKVTYAEQKIITYSIIKLFLYIKIVKCYEQNALIHMKIVLEFYIDTIQRKGVPLRF